MKKVIIIALLAMFVAACGHHGYNHHSSTANTDTTSVS